MTEERRVFTYFAYGSNMLTERIQARCPSATPIGKGFLDNHGLEFSKAGSDNSGKAAPTRKTGLRLLGTLFEIHEKEIVTLDHFEGAGFGYDREQVLIAPHETATPIPAHTYFATHRDSSLKPYNWYLALVLAGAVQHRLSNNHHIDLRKVISMEDPEPDRPQRLQALTILSEAGFIDLYEELRMNSSY